MEEAADPVQISWSHGTRITTSIRPVVILTRAAADTTVNLSGPVRFGSARSGADDGSGSGPRREGEPENEPPENRTSGARSVLCVCGSRRPNGHRTNSVKPGKHETEPTEPAPFPAGSGGEFRERSGMGQGYSGKSRKKDQKKRNIPQKH